MWFITMWVHRVEAWYWNQSLTDPSSNKGRPKMPTFYLRDFLLLAPTQVSWDRFPPPFSRSGGKYPCHHVPRYLFFWTGFDKRWDWAKLFDSYWLSPRHVLVLDFVSAILLVDQAVSALNECLALGYKTGFEHPKYKKWIRKRLSCCNKWTAKLRRLWNFDMKGLAVALQKNWLEERGLC